MAKKYPDTVKYDAMLLYLEGKPYEAIARELKAEFGVSSAIIRRWSNENDWEIKRQQFRKEREENVISKALSLSEQMMSKLEILIKATYNSVVDDMGNATAKTGSIDRAMVSIVKAMEFFQKLEREKQERFNPSEFLRVILDSLYEVPEIATALDLPGVREKFHKILKGHMNRRLDKEVEV